ncbi:DUF2085 domain-containing protein [Candidatus Altiarchaeota archaeon]
MKAGSKAFILFLFFNLLLAFALVAPNICQYMGLHGTAYGMKAAASQVCHQRPDRSLTLLGYKMIVCARCTGIYAGLIASTILYPLTRGLKREKIPDAIFLVIALIPMAVDGTSQLMGFRESTNAIRLVSGFIFGAVIPAYMIPATALFIKEVRQYLMTGEDN